jgi:hypothetical protein
MFLSHAGQRPQYKIFSDWPDPVKLKYFSLFFVYYTSSFMLSKWQKIKIIFLSYFLSPIPPTKQTQKNRSLLLLFNKKKKHHSYNFFFNSKVQFFHPSTVAMPNWELKNCCDHDQKLFIAFVGVYTVVILLVTTSFSLNPFFILVLKWKT